MDSIIVFFGEYFAYILIAGFLVFWWANRKKHPRILWESFLATVLARGIITQAIQFFWDRPRPFVENNIAPLIEHVSSPSFPSGHATFFFALGTVLYLYNKKAGAFFLLGAAILSLARVFAGLHWPSDVIGGAVVGIASVILVVQFSRKFFK